ncbi:GerAB/ArcD/ProY family transporter [Ammoniphilus resinae]|uniref:Spore germination protein KB n=1 Tax=Ammoniphilus resinae TaxID=861532 RepID=A0ABS4GPA3_9BACL|nr:endospore germination permease [Ammoniphilus resinae]MBP1932104.1 spore germination protein KB [Ammoniphilus resinae]
MQAKEKIMLHQFTLLVIIFTIGSSILITPAGLARIAKQDAWMVVILATGISMLFISLYNSLGRRFPGMTLTEINEQILGKWLGKIVSLLFISYFFILASALTLEIGDFMTTQIMPETPIQAVQIIFISIVVMGVRYGLGTFSRAAEIFFPWILFFILFLTFSLLPQVNYVRIEPVFENGIKPILQATVPMLGLPFLELVVFLMIIPAIQQTKKVGKAFYAGTIIGGFILLVITLLTVYVLGSSLTSTQMYPSYVLAKKVNIGGFLQRVEAIMAGIWFLTIYFKITICFYASSLGLAQTFKLNDYRPLIFPLGMLLIALTQIISPNIVYFNYILRYVWTPYSLTYGLFFPLLLLVVAVIRKQKVKG